MSIIQKPSPHHEDRKDGKTIQHLILHYTDTKDIQETLDILDKQKLSAHYVVDTNGDIYQLVNEEKRAWHAGKSYWSGEEDLNSTSIGIEIQNPGAQYGYTDFPQAQIDAVKKLCKDIIKRHNILPHHVLGHSDIAPARKKDPGEKFPWKELATAGIGFFPTPEPCDHDFEEQDALLDFGYDPDVDAKTRVTAFQMHFVPEIFKTPDLVGTLTPETLDMIYAVKLYFQQGIHHRPKTPKP